jgi:protein gp37
VIQGGESGPNKRKFDPDWARKLKAECEATGTAYFFKQIDKVKQIPNDLMIREYPSQVFSCGLKAACGGSKRTKQGVITGFQL